MTAEKKIKGDIILIASLVLLVLLCALALTLFKKEGDAVRVSVDGKEWGVYSLSVDREVEIVTEYGRNTLVIKDGKAEIREASCPDGICSAHRAVSHSGESIICLPNKVVVEVLAEGSGVEPDIIV